MGDIEDLDKSANIREGRHADAEISAKRNSSDAVLGAPNTRAVVGRSGVDVPGDATIYVHTFGCGHNISDSEYMSGLLFERGYRLTDDFDAADAYLINSCTVKNPSEDHFVTLTRRARATTKPVIVAGCVPAGEPDGAEWRDVSVVGVRQIHRVAHVVEEALRGNSVRLFDGAEAAAARHQQQPQSRRSRDSASRTGTKQSSSGGGDDDDDGSGPGHGHGHGGDAPSGGAAATAASLPSLLLPKVRRNKFIEIIPINVGCLNTCTYCKTKHARGDLQSWPVAEIVQRVKTCVAEGVKEIYLTSEDTGAYGIDLGTDIVRLLHAVLAVLEPTDVMLRLGMTNPPYLIRHLDAIGPLFRHKNFFEFAHIPVQSGSDEILNLMKREYSVDEFRLCVRKLRAAAPGMTIATDIICAFPFEGEAEWQGTMALCREMQFPVLNISRFYPRRGTPAAAMKQVPTEVAKKRTQELSQLFNGQQLQAAGAAGATTVAVGTVWRIWITDTAHDKHNLIGHTKNFVQVLVDPAETALGDHVDVQITELSRFCAKGKVLRVLGKAADGTAASAKLNSGAAAAAAAAAGAAAYGGCDGGAHDADGDGDGTKSGAACCGAAAQQVVPSSAGHFSAATLVLAAAGVTAGCFSCGGARRQLPLGHDTTFCPVVATDSVRCVNRFGA